MFYYALNSNKGIRSGKCTTHLTIIFIVVDIIVIKLDMVIVAEICLLTEHSTASDFDDIFTAEYFFFDLTVIDLLNVRKV